MTRTTPPTNLAHSVHDRLLVLANERGRPFNELLQYYAMERFLYRLANSPARQSFVLKGALLLAAHAVLPFRPTRDIDLLGSFDNSEAKVRELMETICRQDVPDDGLRFDSAALTTARIKEDADYPGVRAQFIGYLGRARITMQVDIGFGDAMTPPPCEIDYPVLLDQPAPRLRAYSVETAAAEKLQAMVYLGELNSRMKDFFDVWMLYHRDELAHDGLRAALRSTFARRKTAIILDPICFTPAFADAKQKDWRAFIRKFQGSDVPDDFATVIRDIHHVTKPIFEELLLSSRHPGSKYKTVP